jgi:hypothetical protein
MIARIASEPESRDYIKGAGVDPQALVAESPRRVRDLTAVMQRTFSNFFSQCGL